jgi:alcohol dehydrogenase (cytochrome c)
LPGGQKNKLEGDGEDEMEWKKPEALELSLACEISSYANAELSVSGATHSRQVDQRTNTMRVIAGSFVLAALLFSGKPARADGDVGQGKKVYETQCASCHSTDVGGQGFGPTLAGVVGRKSGTVAGYQYTSAMTNAGFTWDTSTLDSFLTSSTQKVPGTAMAVTVTDAKDRENVSAYLATLKRSAAKAAPAAAVQPATATPTGGPTQEELSRAATDSKDWLYATKDYTGRRFVDLGQINTRNVDHLRPVCIYRADTAGPTQTGLVVYEGVMYLSVDQTIVALDAATCRKRWVYSWPVKDKIISPTNRGVALKDGRVVRGTADGYLIAVDMHTGTLLWSEKIADAKANQYLSMPPLIFGDLVIYGPAGSDWGQKGWIGAFKLDTGEPVWRFNLIPDANEPGAETWGDPQALAHGGTAVWTPVSLDEEKGVLFVPVANPAPDFYPAARPGTNLYSCSVVALDIRTGKLLWYKQFVPNDAHDADLDQVSPLFHAEVKGKTRNLLTVGGKDGMLRVLDRDSQEVLYELPITTIENADTQPSVAGIHTCPGLLGGMEWNGPAYNPKTNTLFAAAVDWCGIFKTFDNRPQYTQNAHYYGGAVTPDPHDQAKGWLYSIDAANGSVRWRQQWPTPLVAGLTATSGGLLLTGDMNDDFLAIDASNGKTLYRFNTGGSIGGGVISYELEGKQYVAATSGVVSGFHGGNGPSAVIVFALP